MTQFLGCYSAVFASLLNRHARPFVPGCMRHVEVEPLYFFVYGTNISRDWAVFTARRYSIYTYVSGSLKASKMYMSKGGAVPIPDWILIFRFFELIFALMTIALTAFSLSVNGGGPLQPPLIATIIIACFTVIPILILTTPLHLAQRKIYDARIALLLDGFAMLFWLGALAALASYQRIFRDYGKNNFFFYDKYTVCTRCRRAWRTGATAAWFSGVEFFLFLFTTLTFIYYFHCHLAGIPAPGVLYQGKGGEDPAGDTAGATTRTATPGAPVDQQQHELQPAQKKSTRSVTNPPYPTNGQPTSQPLQRNPPKQRKGGYDGYEAGSTEGYGVNTTEP